MIRERILFRLFFSLLLLLSFSPFCTYEPASQIHPNRELASIKCASRAAQRSREGRRKVLVLELSDLMVKISGLKAIRKAGDQQIKAFEYMIFKEIVKDRYGEKAYHEILEAVEQELQAYKASGLMRHEYTRSGAKSNVTSINKL